MAAAGPFPARRSRRADRRSDGGQERPDALTGGEGHERAAPAAFCRRRGFGYLVRVKPKVVVKVKGFHGKLPDYPVKRGVAEVLKDAAYRADGAVTRHVVVRWKPGLPPKRDECRFLMTDPSGTAHRLCALYGRRMTIEQLFRRGGEACPDGKSEPNGWSLRGTRISTPDRLLLVLAVAYLLLCRIGLIARKEYKPAAWCSSRKEQCSLFRIGLIMVPKLKASPPRTFAAILELSETVARNWG